MEASSRVLKVLNGLLTTELRAINQYFLDSKLAQHWGYEHLAAEFRKASFEEMNDAESLMNRILDLGGLPNLQRTEPFQAGETVPEQLQLARDLEVGAVKQLKEAVGVSEADNDQGTATLLRTMLLDEEGQLSWLDTQLLLIRQLGEANYLSQQVRG